MYLRDVGLDDVPAYVAMRCDPAMMVHLGGPRPRDGIEAKVRRDVADVAGGRAEICMVVADESESRPVAGTVTLYTHEMDGEDVSEIGWMILPPFQGQGLAGSAVRALLRRIDPRRWGRVHAFPARDNVASNGICRSVGFTMAGAREIEFADQVFQANHWYVDPHTYAEL